MKPVFFIAIVLVGIFSYMGARMSLAPKLELAQQRVKQLESDKTTLSTQLESLKGNLLTDAEKKRIERERKELASLRGEVALLRKEVEALKNPKPTAQNNGTAEEASEVEADQPYEEADYYSAALNVAAESGMTLITGGWQTAPGQRTFIFMTPTTSTAPDGSGFIQISTKVASIPDAELGAFQLQNMKVQGSETDSAGGFDRENAGLLFEGIQRSEQASLVASPTIVTADGKEAVIQTAYVQQEAGERIARNLEIGVIPTVTSTGAIEMNVATTITRPTPPAE